MQTKIVPFKRKLSVLKIVSNLENKMLKLLTPGYSTDHRKNIKHICTYMYNICKHFFFAKKV